MKTHFRRPDWIFMRESHAIAMLSPSTMIHRFELEPRTVFFACAAILLTTIGCDRFAKSNAQSTAASRSQAGPLPEVQIDSEGNSDLDTRRADDEQEEAVRLAVGDVAPDFEIELLGGETFRLSQHLSGADGPTILLFDRAHW